VSPATGMHSPFKRFLDEVIARRVWSPPVQEHQSFETRFKKGKSKA
jgi:hypothetical protein